MSEKSEERWTWLGPLVLFVVAIGMLIFFVMRGDA